jgi:hypothetical protein
LSRKFEFIASEKASEVEKKKPKCQLNPILLYCLYKTVKGYCTFKHPCRHKKDNNFTYVRNDSEGDIMTMGENEQGKNIARLVKSRDEQI